MQIVRYLDSIHEKIQIASSILNAFSKGLNLGNIPKIHLSAPAYKQALPGKARWSLCGW